MRERVGIFGFCVLVSALTMTAAAVDAHVKSYNVVYAFAGGSDGAAPQAGVSMDAAGNLYGTTFNGGGVGVCQDVGGCGTVFKIAPDGAETVLVSFDYTNGAFPLSTPFVDKSGDVYGTTLEGGAGIDAGGDGTIFKIAPDGTEAVLHSFCVQSGCPDGASPLGNLITDKAGDFYGLTNGGGASGDGVIFKFTHRAKLQVLYAFSDPLPMGNLVKDAAGNFYAITYEGGTNNTGAVVKVSRKGVGTRLYSFGANGSGDGVFPTGVAVDQTGNVFGVTQGGGAHGAGAVFEVTANGTETILYSFAGGDDGARPSAPPVLDKSGNLYGLTGSGGVDGDGVVFRLTPAGKETVLHAFADFDDGNEPLAGLLATKGGTFYGTTFYGGGGSGAGCGDGCGTVFKLVN
ncbi:MAG TPA: choice-of-anchor tandem repeat GloVer-containing protein [Rhizomicrobium sp.]